MMFACQMIYLLSCKRRYELSIDIQQVGISYDITTMIFHWSQGQVTTASLKQAYKKDKRYLFFIRLYLKKFCASILDASQSKLWGSKHVEV